MEEVAAAVAAATAVAEEEEEEEEEDEEEERSIGSSGSIEAPEVSNCLTGGRALFFLSHTPVRGAAICIVQRRCGVFRLREVCPRSHRKNERENNREWCVFSAG